MVRDQQGLATWAYLALVVIVILIIVVVIVNVR
jgi:hypothetical protein